MGKLLVAAGDKRERMALARVLRAVRFEVTAAASVGAALGGLQSSSIDAVVVAEPLGIPEIAETCRAIRATTTVPLLSVVRGRGSRDRISALRAGADDALSAPYAPEELVARVRALLRRSVRGVTHVVQHGELAIDLARQQVRIRGVRVYLTPTEFRLLALLACAPGRPFTRREILEYVWDSSHVNDDRVCDVYVSNLRRKIEGDPRLPRSVETVRGVGYAFVGGGAGGSR